MKKLLTLTLSLLLLTGISYGQGAMPNLTLTTHDGGSFDLFTELDEGRSVLMDFWWVECTNCVYWADDVEALYNEYNQNTEELYVIGLNITDPNDAKAGTNDNAGITSFKTGKNLTYPDAGWEGNGSGSNTVRTYWGANIYPWLGGSFAECVLIVPDGQNASNNDIKWYDNGAIHIPSGTGQAEIKQAMSDNNSKAIYDSVQLAKNVGIKTATTNDFKVRVFPNPASDVVSVDVKNLTGTVGIQIVDMMGAQVYNVSNIQNGLHVVNTDALASGIYFLSIQTDTQKLTRKINIQ